MAVPNTFATATTTIPLANLDANFAYYDAAFSISGAATTFLGGVTLSTGAANGVAYLNGSNVLTTGSALTFDGTNFATSGGVILNNARYYYGKSSGGSTVRLMGINSIDVFYLGIDTGPTSMIINASTTSTNIGFNASGSEQMRLTSTGLGIGTSSPAYKLDVSSSGTTVVRSYASAGNQAYVSIAGNAGVPGTSAFDIIQDGSSNTFLYNRANTYMAFGTTNTERMRLDNSGQLGIGVTPSIWYQGSAVGKAIQIGSSTALYDYSATGNVQTRLYNNAYLNTAANHIYLTTNSASYYSQISGAHTWYNAPSGTAGNAISFTQAMTLDASGNLLVGTTTSGLVNANSCSLQPAGFAVVNHASGAASGSVYAYFGYNAVSIGTITQNGTTGVLYNIASDQRLKENIVDADSASSLVDALQVRQYDWKADGSHQRYGFVAQELVTVVPEAVHQPADPEEMMAVDYSKLVPMLVKEIQDLRKRLAALEAK